METNTQKTNFFNEIKGRYSIPFRPINYAYFGYLIGILIGFGGLGIWVSIYQEFTSVDRFWSTVPTAMSTYFIALLASSFIDLNVLPNTINRVSMLIYSVIFLGLGFLLFWLSNVMATKYAFIPAILGVLFALLTWHIANCDSDKFSDESYNATIRSGAKGTHGQNWGKSNNS